MDDPEGVVTQDENNANHFYANKSGTFSVTGTANGMSDTTEVHVLMGNYAQGSYNPWSSKLVGVGETLDLREDAKKHFYPENADYSDEKLEFKKSYDTPAFDLNDGVLKGKSYGSGEVVAELANGEKITYSITVADDPTWIAFDQKEYSYDQSSGAYLKYLLTSDNNNAIRNVSDDQIMYSVDNSDVAEINTGYIHFNKAGDVTVTAKYKELTASCVMHIFEGENPYKFESVNGNSIKIHTGKSKKVEYELGSKNSIEKVSISNSYHGDTEVSEKKAKFDIKTQMFTAYEDGYYYLELTDKLGKTNSWTINVGPEATSFKFVNKEKVYTTRDASIPNYNYIQTSFEPSGASRATEVKYEVIEGDSDVIELDTNSSYSVNFRIKKAGKVTIKGTTDNGLSDTMVIDARVGNYATGFEYDKELKYLLKAGETINVKDDVESTLLPKDEDLSDEKLTYSIPKYNNQGIVDVSQDGTITALKNGSTTIQVSAVGDMTKNIEVAVADKINEFKFRESNIELELSRSGSSAIGERWLAGDFVTDPTYIQNIIKYNEIEFISSKPEVGEVYMNGNVPVFRGYKDGVTTLTAKYKGITTTMDIDVYTATPATSMDIPSEITIHKGFQKSVDPTYNKHAIKSTHSQLLGGDDVVKFNSYYGGFSIEGMKVGTAVVKVTSASNANLTKTVKVNVVDGYPKANVSMIDDVTGDEFTSSGAYSLKVNQQYTIHVTSESGEFPLENNAYEQIKKSDVLESVNGGGDTGNDFYENYISFKTVKSGTVTLEVYPGTKVALRVGDAGFIDTPADSTPHNDDVQWLASSGISTGYPDGTFRPYIAVTRCDMAAFIRRLAQNKHWLDAATWTPSEADWSTFKDIDKNSPHAEDVLWLAHAEISQG